MIRSIILDDTILVAAYSVLLFFFHRLFFIFSIISFFYSLFRIIRKKCGIVIWLSFFIFVIASIIVKSNPVRYRNFICGITRGSLSNPGNTGLPPTKRGVILREIVLSSHNNNKPYSFSDMVDIVLSRLEIMPNMFLSPLIVNYTKYFWREKNHNFVGFVYATADNIFYLTLLIIFIFNVKKIRFFKREDRRIFLTLFFFWFLCGLSLTCSNLNYLTLIRRIAENAFCFFL
jgi:hypothetical protein